MPRKTLQTWTMIKKTLLLAAALLILGACETLREQDSSPDSARADAIIEAAHLSHNGDRIIAVADSLEAAGDFSHIKADYWRGYGYYSKWNQHMCQHYWYEAITLEIKTPEDLEYHARAANRLSDVLLTKGEFESALRVALPAIEKLKEAGTTQSRDYAYMLVTMGCVELNSRNKDIADDYFSQAYKLFSLLIENNGIDGGATLEDNLKSAVAGFTTVSRHCLDKQYYADVLVWVDRLDEVMEIYKRQPETLPESIDRRETLSCIFRASALEGLGNHEAASAAYDQALTHPFCFSQQGRVEAARYLMLARRWSEAADNYGQLNDLASAFGAGLTLDNIQLYLLPKFRANFYARRTDDALVAAIRLCDALDSAIVWNRKDKAAELATLYHTQEIKDEFVAQNAHLDRLRFISAVVVIVLLSLGFMIFVFLRQHASLRLEDAYRQLDKARAQAEEASEVKTAFMQQISHEVGTPLHLISGFAQLLTTPGIELDDETREQINSGVKENTLRITGLVNKMLELSNLMSKSQLERNDRVLPRQIADDAVSTSGIGTAPDIDFEIRGSGEMDFEELLTNRRAASHVLALLLENAIKFTGKGSVCLRVVFKQRSVFFFVEDTGIGVPPEQAEHIFEQFVQLDDYREGTGIGLTVARRLARQLGGDVALDTSYTFGARFVFSLPREADNGRE